MTELRTAFTDETSRYKPVATVCVALALASLAADVTLPGELQGHLQGWSFIRKSVTKVLNSGTAWASVAVIAGWHSRRWWAAFVAGIAAAAGTLAVYYIAGVVTGLHPGGMSGYWFQVALVLCGPLGLVGWVAARRDWTGVMARLVVPVGAVAEALFMDHFVQPYPGRPWAERWSDVSSGVLLVALGVLGAGWLLVRGSRLGGDAASR